ncbi:MAG: threonylcarbamoyl-AMP synthase [Thiotrichaceae bacterium]|nr:threonylcarbamoyl-AMP synthase [Thiotrichaceae bacterium]PCI12272.1 MAG: threonylcarbamoyl-AMP synthase [Thiotrichales bacterium]
MKHLRVHSENPQLRLINQAVGIIRAGGVVVYPTDSCYALGCGIGNKSAMDRIRRIRDLDEHHNFTLICRDLSELATYAKVDNHVFRRLKSLTPGPYTFILEASREVPRRLQHPKRKSIGLRVPEHPIAQMLLSVLDEPMMSVTLILPGDDEPLTDPDEMVVQLGKRVDLLIDGGWGGYEPSTVVDLTGDMPVVVRRGVGDPAAIEG